MMHDCSTMGLEIKRLYLRRKVELKVESSSLCSVQSTTVQVCDVSVALLMDDHDDVTEHSLELPSWAFHLHQIKSYQTQ